MAQNAHISLTAGQWTQLTNAEVTALTFQNLGDIYLHVKANTSTSAPTSLDGAIRYAPTQGERNVDLADLFPGISGASRLWGWCSQDCEVFVSHA